MRTKFVSSLRTLWDAGKRRGGRVGIGPTPFEQSQQSWAKSIASYADVPDPYRCYFEPLEAEGVPFPVVVMAPSYEGFLRRETEKLVCSLSDEVIILEKRGHTPEVHRFPVSAIDRVEVSSVLLDTRIKITGWERDGLVPASATVRFNAVTDFLFAPIVTGIRTRRRARKAPSTGKPDPFQAWGRRNFKFMNYARRSLIGDEAVIQAVLQPEIRVAVVSAFGRTIHRTLSPTHAAILTDRELITIREIPYKGDRERYGGIWEYLTLDRIERLSMTEDDRGLMALSIHLPGGSRMQLQYEPAARDELETLVAGFSESVATRTPSGDSAAA
jgi:hypothetical protein